MVSWGPELGNILTSGCLVYWQSAMLSSLATIRAELERLEKARKDCTDSGLRKWIEGAIEKQKQKLASEQGNNIARIPPKPSE